MLASYPKQSWWMTITEEGPKGNSCSQKKIIEGPKIVEKLR